MTSAFPPALSQLIRSVLFTRTGSDPVLHAVIPVSGGSINKTYRVKTSKGDFFVKVNDAEKFPGMLEAEAKGLELLRSTNEFFIPSVIGTMEEGHHAVFVSEFVEEGQRSKNFFYEFGQALARLHAHTSASFGLDHPNYIGSLPQSNLQHDTWAGFFIHERLEPQLKRAVDAQKLGTPAIQSFLKLYSRLEAIFPPGKPALLHGDLWSGNYRTAPGGSACIFDPAVYYGHREMDLAMTRLFGGFAPDFYEGYHAQFPLEKGWEQRVDICNLYPLLVHVNLFGGGYTGEVEGILKRFA